MGRVYSPYIRGKGPGRAPANPLSRGAYVATIDLGRILFLALIFLCASLPSVQLRAQPNTTTSSSYLLIVETSRAMQPRARAVYDSIKEILDSNFKGQLREGDKFGIWTFSDTLDTGYMPLAAWSSDTHLTSAMRAGRFSQTDTYANRPSLDKVVPELNRLLLQPGSVTVLLYTTGKNDLHGTALDDQLNATFKEWQDQQQKANMPLVTLLYAQDGKITHWSVTPAPWPVDLPARTTTSAPSQLAQAQAAALQIAESIKPSSPSPTSDIATEAKSELKDTLTSKAQEPTASSAAEPEVKLSAPPPQPQIASTTLTDSRNTPADSQEPKPTSPAKTEVKENSNPAPAPAVGQENSASTSVAPAQEAPSPVFVYRRRKQVAATSTTNPVTEQPLPLAEPKSENASPPVAASTAKTETSQPNQPLARAEIAPPPTDSPAPALAPAASKAHIQSAVATPHKSLLSENLFWLGCLALIGIATATCFMFWIRSFRRPAIPALTLHDLIQRGASPSMATPIKRANLPPEKTFPPSHASTEADSTTVQE